MAEIEKITFSYQEVVEALVKKQGIHEGIWGIYLEFAIGGANIGTGNDDILPSAIIPVVKIGLQKTNEITNISLDAAVVNPRK